MNLPLLFVLGFLCELIDTSIGGGYGILLVPLAITMGIEPLYIIPAVLFSEICTGLLGGFIHQQFKNVNFEIVILDVVFGFFGAVIGALTSVSIPEVQLKPWIGLIVLALGILLIHDLKGRHIVKGSFKLRNHIPLTLLGSFNKVLLGGGYGPIGTAGLILIKADPKKSVGSSTLAEGIVSLMGLLLLTMLGKASFSLNSLTLCLTLGSCLATLPGALITKKIDTFKLKLIISTFMVLLGLYTLFIGLLIY